MESAELTNVELHDELRKARAMVELADQAGEADASALYSSIIRALEFEQRNRETGR